MEIINTEQRNNIAYAVRNYQVKGNHTIINSYNLCYNKALSREEVITKLCKLEISRTRVLSQPIMLREDMISVFAYNSN